VNHISKLRARRRVPVAIVHRFRLMYGEKGTALHYLFFEGETDRDFFDIFINAKLSGERAVFVCDGKEGVLSVARRLGRESRESRRLLFFLDRDHDPFLGKPLPRRKDFFVTEYYSIENYLVCEGLVANVLRRFMRLDNTDPIYDECMTAYQAAYTRYAKLMAPFMAWVIVQRRMGKTLNLSNVNLQTVVSMDGMVEKRPSGFRTFQKQCAGGNPRITLRLVVETRKELLKVHVKKYLRGKFELWFLIQWITRVARSLRGRLKVDGRKVAMGVQITSANALQLLSGLLPCPRRLERFLAGYVL
jgi:Protein of unknown function (DUF4435)